MKDVLFYIALIVVPFFCLCCANKDILSTPVDWDQATKIEYRYGDTSVAPDYHRSYTIAITDNSKSITIDSYGEVLLTRQYPNTSADFQAFKEQLNKQGIATHKETDSGGCSGGTTEHIRLYNEDTKFFDAYVYHCSGSYGTLTLPAGTADLFSAQIPEGVNALIKSTLTRH